MAWMSEHEVRFALARLLSICARDEPGNAMKGDEIVVGLVTQALEQLPLTAGSRIVDLVRDHLAIDGLSRIVSLLAQENVRTGETTTAASLGDGQSHADPERTIPMACVVAHDHARQGTAPRMMLLPRFATHPATGAFEGIGIKRFPAQGSRRREETSLF
jgi:hypothetical protein